MLRKSFVNDAVQFVRMRLRWLQVNTLSIEQSGGRRTDCVLRSFFFLNYIIIMCSIILLHIIPQGMNIHHYSSLDIDTNLES